MDVCQTVNCWLLYLTLLRVQEHMTTVMQCTIGRYIQHLSLFSKDRPAGVNFPAGCFRWCGVGGGRPPPTLGFNMFRWMCGEG